MRRRQFIEFIGQGTLSLQLLPYLTNSVLRDRANRIFPLINPIKPSSEDRLILADGLNSSMIAKWGDPISKTDTFGFNNDFICFVPMEDKTDEGILWVNHEYVDSFILHGNPKALTPEQVKQEQYEVGGSLLHIRKKENKWELVPGSEFTRRITGETMLPFNWDQAIAGSNVAKGTLGNCAGGLTPWGTILTCEENYQMFYGERKEDGISPSFNGWEVFDPQPPEHYGWIVEIEPFTGKGQKHVALGRFSHECATVVELSDGRVVVYSGDDQNDEHLYKFISNEPKNLKDGTLYVAQLETGKWISLSIDEQPLLASEFENQTEVLINVRKAAKLLGATPLDRPEDIEIDPLNGHVLVTLTNNVPKGNYFGSILKITESENNHESLDFEPSTLLAGGEETGFASPDNMIFDRAGNLWFTSDISGGKMNKPPYSTFKNNGLFILPRTGDQAGQVLQVASAPTDAELTGPWFSPDGRTLFLSVQHPGEQSSETGKWTSHWPAGNGSKPKSAIIAIQGELINNIQNLN